MGRQKNKVKWHLEVCWIMMIFFEISKRCEGSSKGSQLQDLVLWAVAQVPQNPHVCTSPLLPMYRLPPWRQSHVCSACWKCVPCWPHYSVFWVREVSAELMALSCSLCRRDREDSCFCIKPHANQSRLIGHMLGSTMFKTIFTTSPHQETLIREVPHSQSWRMDILLEC